jgi:transketolase
MITATKEISSKELARKIRIHSVEMVNSGGSSHIGSILSIVDILAVLYGCILNYRADNPEWEKRDRFILSKGHAGVAVYATLAEVGFFKVENLVKHYRDGSNFSGHISHKNIPGVEISTGSLGHGLSIASGMAMAAKINNSDNKVFVLMGDGELNEGSNWEAFMFASHNGLNKLVAIIDRNNLQSIRSTEETLALEPLREKLNSFGWHVIEVDGHSHNEIKIALQCKSDKPIAIIANTIKGKGVSYMENKVEWHYRTPKGHLFDKAIKELKGQL